MVQYQQNILVNRQEQEASKCGPFNAQKECASIHSAIPENYKVTLKVL